MRRFDKNKNMTKANLLAETRYFESKGLISETERKTAQELNLSDKIFYHGTTSKIDKLNPTFRQSSPDAMSGKRSGSSNSGTGIYFSKELGFDPENPKYSENGSLVNTSPGGENAYKWAYSDDKGYIYIMRLKPTANIVDKNYDKLKFDERNINLDEYNILRKNGVDAVWSEGELVLLNPDAIENFKLKYQLGTKYKVGPMERGKIRNDLAKLLDEKDVEPFLKQELGDTYKKGEVRGQDTYFGDESAIIVIPVRNRLLNF